MQKLKLLCLAVLACLLLAAPTFADDGIIVIGSDHTSAAPATLSAPPSVVQVVLLQLAAVILRS